MALLAKNAMPVKTILLPVKKYSLYIVYLHLRIAISYIAKYLMLRYLACPLRMLVTVIIDVFSSIDNRYVKANLCLLSTMWDIITVSLNCTSQSAIRKVPCFFCYVLEEKSPLHILFSASNGQWITHDSFIAKAVLRKWGECNLVLQNKIYV